MFSLQAPDVVVFPESTEEVSMVAKLCSENATPMIPFGTGTGMEGGVTAIKVRPLQSEACSVKARARNCVTLDHWGISGWPRLELRI